MSQENLIMFIRRKINKSGSKSVQVIDKSSGRYTVRKSFGSSKNEKELQEMEKRAAKYIEKIQGQIKINFDYEEEERYVDRMLESISTLQLIGPELIFGKIFNEIGFNVIKDELFKELVICRIAFPASKLRTVEYLYRYKGKTINVQRIYRYMDKLNNLQKETIQEISINHTIRVLGSGIRVVFYDVTTLYFESENQDALRINGFSKEGRHSNPQIILGLLISITGDPLAYEIYEGNKYEGSTMLPVVEEFVKKYKIDRLVVVADSGLLSSKNIQELQTKGYEYILGARIKNEKESIRTAILQTRLQSGETTEIQKDDGSRLIISYSEKRAKKDEFNRRRGIEKLAKRIKTGKLTKSNINNKGYNKFLTMEGNIDISIDLEKVERDKQWDGLKGYITNTNLKKEAIIEQYGNLWRIEKAFRIAKSDLRIRPIYHRIKERIEAHICIAFCAYKVYKEFERQLKVNNVGISVEKAIDIVNSIYKISFITPYSETCIEKIITKNRQQELILQVFS